MARGKRKSVKNRVKWFLLLFMLLALVSFCLPWVAVPSAVVVPPSQINLPVLEHTLIERSFRSMYLFSLHENNIVTYAGYQVPVIIWNTESKQPGKLVCLVAGTKNIRYRGLLLYLYPVLLVVLLLLIRKRKYCKFGKWLGMAVCAVICWVQFVKIGLSYPSVMTLNFYLDYGFWLGAVSFLLFGITLFWVKT